MVTMLTVTVRVRKTATVVTMVVKAVMMMVMVMILTYHHQCACVASGRDKLRQLRTVTDAASPLSYSSCCVIVLRPYTNIFRSYPAYSQQFKTKSPLVAS